VPDAGGSGVAQIGHTASFYWQGKMPAAASRVGVLISVSRHARSSVLDSRT
jgi:TRAP-type mannitol/chloroaromatic compound transport system substrate-binding protein